MKNRNLIKLFSVILIALFAACSNVTSNDPNEVLHEFFEHLAKKDIDGASKYVTTESKPTMQLMKKGLSMAEKMEDKSQKIDAMKEFEDMVIEPAKIMGDSALVTVKSKSNNRPNAEFKLLKQSNGWKVDFTMTALMNMGLKGIHQDKEAGALLDSVHANSEDIEKGIKMADSVLKNLDPSMVDKIKKQLENIKQ